MSEIDDSGKRINYGEGQAMREPSDGKGRFDLITPYGLRRLARWYELGAKKYEDRNWEKGMPFSRYLDSALRHLNKFTMGCDDEDHLSAAAWNILCIIHHQERLEQRLDDMPHYEGSGIGVSTHPWVKMYNTHEMKIEVAEEKQNTADNIAKNLFDMTRVYQTQTPYIIPTGSACGGGGAGDPLLCGQSGVGGCKQCT